MSTPELSLVVVTAFLASIVAAVVGFRGGVILLPVLIAVCGVRDAVSLGVSIDLRSALCWARLTGV